MTSISIQLRKIMYLTLGMMSSFIPSHGLKIIILCYHSISDDGWRFSVKKTEFEKQMHYLSSKFQFISLADLNEYIRGDKIITQNSVVINFDDGYKDILSIRDVVKKYNIKPTVFIIADSDNPNRAELETDKELLSNSDVLLLLNDGWEIGSHTLTHPDLMTLSQNDLKREIFESKKQLEQITKIQTKYIAYPKGRYNMTTLQEVRKNKYLLGLTMDDTVLGKNSDPLTLPRIGIDGTHTFAEFKRLYLPINIWLRGHLKKLL